MWRRATLSEHCVEHFQQIILNKGRGDAVEVAADAISTRGFLGGAVNDCGIQFLHCYWL